MCDADVELPSDVSDGESANDKSDNPKDVELPPSVMSESGDVELPSDVDSDPPGSMADKLLDDVDDYDGFSDTGSKADTTCDSISSWTTVASMENASD